MFTPDPDFERLRLSLLGGHGDRVPLAEITIDEGAKEAFLGKPLNDLATDIEFYTRAGYDFITLGRRMAGYPPVWSAARNENYYDVQREVAHGTSDGVIHNREDFKSYPWMRPGELDFRILDDAERLLPKKMKVIRYLGPVFQMTWMLMGFDAFAFSLADDPGLVEAMMDRIFDLVIEELTDALERDIVGAVWYGDDIAIKDRLMVSPAFLRKNFFPKLRIIGEACRKKGVPLIYHSDGNIIEVLDDIVAAGVSALHPIDPTGMDIYKFKPAVEGRLCIIGNVDVDLLTLGTPKEVEADTLKHIQILAPSGGYVLGSSNSIPRSVRPENYRIMLDTVLSAGEYPT